MQCARDVIMQICCYKDCHLDLSTLLYGAKLWTLKKEDVQRLESCGIWLWKEVLNITWSDRVCNEEELRRDGEERAIISVINRRQRVWLGQTLRHGDHVSLVIEGRIPGKRPPGRPQAEMLDRVKDGSFYVAVKMRALNREL